MAQPYKMNFEHIFDQLEISTEPFALCELHGKCNLDVGKDSNVSLHYILNGEGELAIKGSSPIKVMPGSLVLIPALKSHALRSFGVANDSHLQCAPPELKLQHLLKVDQEKDGIGQVIALCAHVRIGLRGAIDVIELIREPIVENIKLGSPMHSTVSQMLTELSQPTTGSRAMIRALLTQCVIEMLRRRLTDEDTELRWMAALRDPAVWTALRAMLDEPGDPHTVESLAELVGMSRSAFANRFNAAYGSGPIELLRELRLQRAATLLQDSDLPVKRIAQMVGFNSRTAFSRVFEQHLEQSPSEYRRYARGE